MPEFEHDDEWLFGATKNSTVRRHLAKNDKCPQCLGELDTGYECTVCGFDAAPDLDKPVASRDIEMKDKKR